MDNVTSQIAHLVDELASRGVKHIRVKGFCGLDEVELSITPSTADSSPLSAFHEDARDNDEDIQYAASGVVPMNIKELYK